MMTKAIFLGIGGLQVAFLKQYLPSQKATGGTAPPLLPYNGTIAGSHKIFAISQVISQV